jgi:hypothetical protein
LKILLRHAWTTSRDIQACLDLIHGSLRSREKAVLAAVDFAALAACIAAAFALVARILALSVLEVPNQAFYSVVFGVLLLIWPVMLGLMHQHNACTVHAWLPRRSL